MIRASQKETAPTFGAAPAAPARGAQVFWGRGCGFLASHASMPKRFAAAFLVATAQMTAPAIAQEATAELIAVEVPSGQDVALKEVLLDESPGALWVRFRFIAPGIKAVRDEEQDEETAAKLFERNAGDMDHLCESLALEYLRHHQLSPALVVISFSDRPVKFGVQDAAATQFFEAYRPEGENCIWEAF
ncbi:hypothetical protein RSK20926_22449 [Roseobacter sp. SK209-2-6]|nr:hypothetical protein RSK20926_22449 [Roseobacter sp. SK209-2-6]